MARAIGVGKRREPKKVKLTLPTDGRRKKKSSMYESMKSTSTEARADHQPGWWKKVLAAGALKTMAMAAIISLAGSWALSIVQKQKEKALASQCALMAAEEALSSEPSRWDRIQAMMGGSFEGWKSQQAELQKLHQEIQSKARSMKGVASVENSKPAEAGYWESQGSASAQRWTAEGKELEAIRFQWSAISKKESGACKLQELRLIRS